MSLQKIYKIWLFSLLAAGVLAAIYFILGMFIQYGTLSPDKEFSGLFHFLIALIIFVAGTGIVCAFLVYKMYKKDHPSIAKKLSILLATYHAVGALPIIYLTILGIPLFAALPYFAWESANEKTRVSKTSIIFGAIVIGIVTLFLVTISLGMRDSK